MLRGLADATQGSSKLLSAQALNDQLSWSEVRAISQRAHPQAKALSAASLLVGVDDNLEE